MAETRVVVVGSSCAGKTTFARRLAERLGVPHVELDAVYWLPDWQTRSTEEFQALVRQAANEPAWVIDGNYRAARAIVWSRATTIVWLNLGFPTVLWRAVTRTVRRSITREELFSGNRESFRLSFLSRESVLWWVITTFHRRRREYRLLFQDPEWARLIRVECRSPADAERVLTGAGARSASG
jgi:adenylate kinase family enzyme